MKYDEKDLPLFKKVICSHCDSYELSCIEKDEENNNHWFLMCPKFFNWVMGFKYNNGITERVKPKREEF